MIAIWVVTLLACLASAVADRRKTLTALRRGVHMLQRLAPMLIVLLVGVSLVLAAATPEVLSRQLSREGPAALVVALLVGAVVLMPGFVAYPLAGMLHDNGAPMLTLAAFLTSLMMVGVLTLPLEASFFGWRVSIQRNLLALVGALLVALGVAWVLP